MNGTARKVGDLPTTDYIVAMTDPLCAVAAVAGALGIRPHYLLVSLNEYHELVDGRPWAVSLQVDTVADADRLAEHYGLPADDGKSGNYTREGVAVVQGIGDVEVCVYTHRPDEDVAEVQS